MAKRRNRASLKWGHKRVREAVYTGERILTPAQTASRHAFFAYVGVEVTRLKFNCGKSH